MKRPGPKYLRIMRLAPALGLTNVTVVVTVTGITVMPVLPDAELRML